MSVTDESYLDETSVPAAKRRKRRVKRPNAKQQAFSEKLVRTTPLIISNQSVNASTEKVRPSTREPFQWRRAQRPTKCFPSKNRQIKQVTLDQLTIKISSTKITNQCHVCGKKFQNLNHHLFEIHGISKIDTVRDSHGYIMKICPKCGEGKTRLRDPLKRRHKLLDTGVLNSLVKLAEPVSGEYKVRNQ